MNLRKISTKLLFLLIVLSLVPLLSFGAISIFQIRNSTLAKAKQSNQQIVTEIASRIEDYFYHSFDLLNVLSDSLSQPNLKDWQKEQIILSYLNQFDRFKEIKIIPAQENEIKVSSVLQDDDLSPVITTWIPIHYFENITGTLEVKINLMQMWKWVDEIRIGHQGFVSIYDDQMKLIATGNGDLKKDVFVRNDNNLQKFSESILSSNGIIANSKLLVGAKIQHNQYISWIAVMEEPLTQSFCTANRISYYLAIFVLILSVMIFFIGIWCGKKEILNPINRLIQATSKVAKGNWNFQLSAEQSKEWNLLVQAFNRMISQIKDQSDKLLLEERHSAFGRIASGLIHDLKYPVSTLSSIVRNLKHIKSEEDRSALFQAILKEVGKMNHHLDLLKLQVKDIPFSPTLVSAKDFCHDLLQSFQLQAKEKNIFLSCNLVPSDFKIKVDTQSLNRALSNLISNSLQALSNNGLIEVSFIQDHKTLKICVNDNGPGMTVEQSKNIFDEFVTSGGGGLGLGLSVTKKIILQHKGKIWCECNNNAGTKMIIEIPQPAD